MNEADTPNDSNAPNEPSFACAACGAEHSGVPMAYRAPVPAVTDTHELVFSFEGERCTQGADEFLLANLTLPRLDAPGEHFVWTAWVSISPESAAAIDAAWDDPLRAHRTPAFAYFMTALPTYEPTTVLLRARVHQRPPGLRPEIELEPTEHPLAVEQRAGIVIERILAVFHELAPS